MSNYKNQLAFVNRTLSILENLSTKTEYEKTLFINCCLGLVVATQQWDQSTNYQIAEDIDKNNWFIDISSATANAHKKGGSNNSVENFAYHLRNCLCHYLFTVIGDSESITSIEIVDYKEDSHTNCTFKITVSVDSLQKFALKYAKKKIELLEKNPQNVGFEVL